MYKKNGPLYFHLLNWKFYKYIEHTHTHYKSLWYKNVTNFLQWFKFSNTTILVLLVLHLSFYILFNSQVRTPNSCNCKVILQTVWSKASIAVVALYRNVSTLDSRGCWDGTDSSSSSNIHDQCWSVTDIFDVRGGVWLNTKSPPSPHHC